MQGGHAHLGPLGPRLNDAPRAIRLVKEKTSTLPAKKKKVYTRVPAEQWPSHGLFPQNRPDLHAGRERMHARARLAFPTTLCTELKNHIYLLCTEVKDAVKILGTAHAVVQSFS